MTTSNVIYNEHIDFYFNQVETGKILVSNEVHQLIEYLKNKLDEEQNLIYIDHKEISEAIESIQKYFPFELLAWENFIIAFVVGVFYKADDSLVFNEFFLMMGRGAGKNGLIAAICFYLISKQKIKKYDVAIVATNEKQAKTSFMDVWEVLDDHWKKLSKHFKRTLEVIGFYKTKSKLEYFTNNAKTKDGLRPGAIIFDEVHAYESEDNIKVFTSALGKVPRPRRFYITTDGNIRDGFLDQMKEEAKMLLNGEIKNSRLFPFICKLDSPEEVHDKRMWEKANPSINYFPHLKLEMETEYNNIEHRKSAKLEFMTKRMNIPSQDSYDLVAEWEKIKATNQEIPNLKGNECIGAVDYSDTTDFVGVGLYFKKGKKRYWLHHTFINQQSLDQNNYKIDIELAKELGLVTIIKDKTNRPEYIVNWFAEKAKEYKLKLIAGDMYRINYLKEEFEKAGFKNIEIARSGSKTHTQLQPIVEDLFAYENLVYGDDMMMRWYTNNVYIKRDAKGNITYEKIEPRLRKTDGFFAFLHALQFDLELKDSTPLTKDNVKKLIKSYSY
ncbi:terminase large subunit [Cytobacillus spongiae]|uniref:terminase TerL endonuclease subunit n=1 Tax=Cytobacillus spongiae TaxID=2901381 RepID=UPI001F37A08E|nr:terminase TerL endonuclease subunit [Cytobacillus spongiae]UII56704.1 terminase large subunit [Cytobacillus spongiae]